MAFTDIWINAATSVLDNFNRADENPLAGGWGSGGINGADAGQLVSDQGLSSGNNGVDFGGSWWATSFGAQQEVYCDLATFSQDMKLYACISNPTVGPGPGGLTGYCLHISRSNADWVISRIDFGGTGRTLLAGSESWAASGDKVLFRVGASGYISAWHYTSAVGAFSPLGAITDTAYNSGGYVGFALYSLSDAIDNFGGGNLP